MQKFLRQIPSTMILEQLNATQIGIFHLKQISTYCNAMNGKTSDF